MLRSYNSDNGKPICFFDADFETLTDRLENYRTFILQVKKPPYICTVNRKERQAKQ